MVRPPRGSVSVHSKSSAPSAGSLHTSVSSSAMRSGAGCSAEGCKTRRRRRTRRCLWGFYRPEPPPSMHRWVGLDPPPPPLLPLLTPDSTPSAASGIESSMSRSFACPAPSAAASLSASTSRVVCWRSASALSSSSWLSPPSPRTHWHRRWRRRRLRGHRSCLHSAWRWNLNPYFCCLTSRKSCPHQRPIVPKSQWLCRTNGAAFRSRPRQDTRGIRSENPVKIS